MLARFAHLLLILLAMAGVSCRSVGEAPEQIVEGDLRFTLVPTGVFPQFLRAADGYIWGVSGRPKFWKVNQANYEMSALPIRWLQRDEIADFAVGHGSVWISTFPPLGAGQFTRRFDMNTGEVQATIDFGGMLAIGEDAVWMFDHRSGVVRRIDPANNSVVRAISVRPRPRWLVVMHGDLWLLGAEDGVITRINGQTNRVEWETPAGEPHESNLWRFIVGGDSGMYTGMTIADNVAWVTDHRATTRIFAFQQPDGTIAHVDLAAKEAAMPVSVGRWPMSPIEFAGSIWFTVVNDRTRTCLARVNPATGRVTAMQELPRHRLYLPASAQTMVRGDDALWIGADGVLQKVTLERE